MSTLQEHIELINGAVQEWLSPDNMDLKKAIDRTVQENLFSMADIKHQIISLKKTVHKAGILTWADNSGLQHQSLQGKKVVCLHAGNLPLVGFQDLLAVVLTGGIYIGKLSKKDPYLLPTFIQILRQRGLLESSSWNTNLSNLSDTLGDAVLFAGSEESVGPVMEKLRKQNIIKPSAQALLRTAQFSVAYIEDNQPKTMKDLTEAVFRYGGQGCRSVAIVIAPFHLKAEKCSFTDYVESFWLHNPQHKKPGAGLEYRYAYNKAVDKPQAWLNDFLIEEGLPDEIKKFVLFWIKGSENDLRRVVSEQMHNIQSVYVQPGSNISEVAGIKTEILSSAQQPPIHWQPDRVDSISWLQNNV